MIADCRFSIVDLWFSVFGMRRKVARKRAWLIIINYQTVLMSAARMRPSRLMTGTPK